MNCEGVRELLSAYIDGELSAGELLRVEQHLRRCHWCADEVDALRRTISLVASLDEVPVPPTFHAQLHERLAALKPPVAAEKSRRKVARRSAVWRWSVPAAAAAAVLVGVAGLNGLRLPLTLPPLVAHNEPPGQTVASADAVPHGSLSPEPAPVDSTRPADTATAPGAGNEQGTPGRAEPGEVPSVTSPVAGEETPVEAPPLGPTSREPGIAVASYLDAVEAPSSYETVRQPGAHVTAVAEDPALVAGELKDRFGDAVTEKISDRTIVLQITVRAEEFADALALVEARTGAKGEDTSVALDMAQLEQLYEQLTLLDQRRENAAARLESQTDPELLALAEQELEQLEQEARKVRENYRKLIDLSATGTITVTLEPPAAE